MSWLISAIDALRPLVEAACGCRCIAGLPDTIAPGCCYILTNETPIRFELNESGGESDRTATLTVVDCNAVTGSRTGDLETLMLASDHLDALTAAIEADTTLGGAVQQARISEAAIYSNPSADNAYESLAEIKVEVTQW